jgi:hypothetical protein
MNNWIYVPSGEEITKVRQLPNHEATVGFVYKITNLKTGKFYIGQKSLYHSRKKKISATEKRLTGTRKKFRVEIKESDWLLYHGSSKELTSDISKLGSKYFKREILELCCSKKYLSYCELSWQVKLDVLKRESYNGNILGRYFNRDMENCN